MEASDRAVLLGHNEEPDRRHEGTPARRSQRSIPGQHAGQLWSTEELTFRKVTATYHGENV